jgi:hypothetical protein
MTRKHWSWEHFVTDNKLYKENKTDVNAWCSGCLALKVLELAVKPAVRIRQEAD